MADLGIPGLGPGNVIGGGGSSTVFAATRTAFGDRVAVKVLKLTVADAISQKQFEREFEALSDLAECDGIVAVLDSGVTERGEPYLILPLFGGSAQSEIEDHGPMPWPRAARMVIQAAHALSNGHQRNILHRDVKPANLLMTDNDDVFLADFGLAKMTERSVTADSIIGLTPAYAPPEIINGQPASVQSDLYSLGATLVALINGESPYATTEAQSAMAIMRQILDGPPEPTVAIPAVLQTFIHRACRALPEQRHASAEAFAAELQSIVDANAGGAEGLTRVTPRADATKVAGSAATPDPDPDSAHEVGPTSTAVSAPEPEAEGARENRTPLIALVAAALIIGIIGVVLLTRGGDETSTGPSVERAGAAATPTAEQAPTVEQASTAPADPPETEEVGEAEADPATDPEGADPATEEGPEIEGTTGRTSGGESPEISEAEEQAEVIVVAPDGSGDFTSLTEAVAQSPFGAILELSEGRHEIDNTVLVLWNLTIRGAGRDLTTLVISDSAAAVSIQDANATLADLTVTTDFDIVAPSEIRALVELVNTGPATLISNVRVTGGNGVGILAGDGAEGRIANSLMDDNDREGFLGVGTSALTLAGNRSENNGRHGYGWNGTAGGEASGNLALGNGSSGFSVADAAQPVLSANTSSGNTVAGFIWAGQAVVQATANAATENDGSGFLLLGDASGTLTGNLARRNGSDGFGLDQATEAEARANRSEGNTRSGFAIVGTASARLFDNRIQDNEGPGISALTTGDLELGDNLVVGSGENDLAIAPTATVLDRDSVRITVEMDGSGDQPDLASAVAAASPGTLIVLGPGIHEIVDPVVLDQPIKIRGQGADVTSIVSSASTKVLDWENVTAFVADVSLGTRHRRGPDDPLVAMMEMLGTAPDSLVVDVRLDGGAIVSFEAAQGTIIRTEVDGAPAEGMAFVGGSAIEVYASESSRNVGAGFFWQGSSSRVVASVAERNGGSGFEWRNDSVSDAVANTASENGVHGFFWGEVASGSALGNQAGQNLRSGFAAADESSPRLVANSAAGNTDGSFTASGDTTALAVGNDFD
ncbi:MAG: right-handed parallel beta-helix repeat-containing protein [Actinomycetota bacterium]